MASPRGRPPRPLADRFWALVKRGGPDECWLWLGMIDQTTGIPRYRVKRNGKIVQSSAARIAIELTQGYRPSPAIRYPSTCGNGYCVNPAHRVATIASSAPREVRRRAERARYRAKKRSQAVEQLAQGEPVDLREPHQRGELRVEHAALDLLQVAQAEVGPANDGHLGETGGEARGAAHFPEPPANSGAERHGHVVLDGGSAEHFTPDDVIRDAGQNDSGAPIEAPMPVRFGYRGVGERGLR